MRILIVHNHYGDFAIGGEAMVMRAEAELLRSHGHEVCVYERTNAEITGRSILGKIKAFKDMTWSPEGYQAIAGEFKKFMPDLMHVHNYKFLLSPSIFKAAKDHNVATCLTLHNYRLACPAGLFLREGHVCEDCLRGFPYRMLWHRCPSNNLITNINQMYLFLGTRRRKFLKSWVDAYIALTEFGKSKFIAGGVPAERIHVKPNFVNEPSYVYSEPITRHGAIFVGRLSREKGIDILFNAWRDLDYPLSIVGDGPLMAELKENAPSNVIFHGSLDHATCLKMMAASAFLVFPSVCYEGFPLSLGEAMATGTAILTADFGPRPEIVEDGVNGLLYKDGDSADLKEKAMRLIKDETLCASLGAGARQRYLERYTPEVNYEMLMGIYNSALEHHKSMGKPVTEKHSI